MKPLKIYVMSFIFILIAFVTNVRIWQFHNRDLPLCRADLDSQLLCYGKGFANGSVSGAGNILLIVALILIIMQLMEKKVK